VAGHRPPSLKVKALQWLAQREYSRAELRARLLRLAGAESRADEAAPQADPAAEVDALLDWLQAHRYLSDARFAESRVLVRAARFGNLRIQGELRQHGVALSPAEQQTLRETEFARALDVWRRKFGPEPAADAAGRVKQMRFLSGRGFSPEVVRRVVKSGSSAD
jgi:regulatory protein